MSNEVLQHGTFNSQWIAMAHYGSLNLADGTMIQLDCMLVERS